MGDIGCDMHVHPLARQLPSKIRGAVQELLKSEHSISYGVVTCRIKSVLGMNAPMNTIKSLFHSNR